MANRDRMSTRSMGDQPSVPSPQEALTIFKAWMLGGIILGVAAWIAVASIYAANGHNFPAAAGAGIGLVMTVAGTVGGLIAKRRLP